LLRSGERLLDGLQLGLGEPGGCERVRIDLPGLDLAVEDLALGSRERSVVDELLDGVQEWLLGARLRRRRPLALGRQRGQPIFSRHSEQSAERWASRSGEWW
jgi:hypothetical protein